MTTGDHFEVANADLIVTSLGKRREVMEVTATVTGGPKTMIMKPIIVYITQAPGPPERVFRHLPLQGADERLLRPL